MQNFHWIAQTTSSGGRAAGCLEPPMRIPFAFLVVLFPNTSAHGADVGIEDVFGRRLNEHGLILVDWEGQIANPAIKFFIAPPEDAAFPARAVLTCEEPRVYFNLPSE